MKAERLYVTAGAALVVAGVVAITPIAPPPPDVHIASPATRLTAASASIANVPVNVMQAIANVPANEIAAMQSMADALLFTGSWWVGSPSNIYGTDPTDPPFVRALVALLVPLPALSGPLGDQLVVLAQAESPVNAECTFWCPNPIAYLRGTFQVPLSQLISGYTFPTVIDPLGPVEGEYGFPGTGPGNTMPWSNTTVKLDPTEPFTSLVESLVNPPTGITIVSPQEVVKTVKNLGEGIVVDFSPFVPGGPFTPGWPYNPATCPPCQGSSTASPASAIRDRVLAVRAELIPSLTPNSGQTFTMNAASIAPGGDVQQNVVKNVVTGNEVGSPNGQQDIQAGVATAPEAPSTTARVSDTGSQAVAPEAGLHTSSTPVEKPNSTTTTSTNVTSDDRKVEPGQSGGRHRKPPAGLAGAVRSVSDRISSSVSKVTDGLKGGRAETGKASTDGTASRGTFSSS